MAENNHKKSIPAIKQDQQVVAENQPLIQGLQFPTWLYDFKTQAFIIAVLAFGFYINTFRNEIAYDDTIVIVKNEYVLEGFAGIPDILARDGYEGYYRLFNSSNQLSGGRYRPLSMVTFAVEQQFFGAVPALKADSIVRHEMSVEMKDPYEKRFLKDMHIRHLMNVLWFTLSVIVLLYFLRYVVFRSDPLIAFIAAILFTIHPIHTEVVANVKSRDEILSLLFICLTFISAFKYHEHKKKWWLVAALASYFLAFLSKEYAITLVAMLPLSFYLFNRYTLRKSLRSSIPYFLVTAVYIFIRLQVVQPAGENAGSNILNNPYANTEGYEKTATEIATSLNYLKLLIWPHPLSVDYSYNTIPYKDFSHPLVWLSLAIHLLLFYGLFYFFKRRNVLCFAIAFYLFNLTMVCNLFFDIGATMGERLIYHSSAGFCIALAYLLGRAAAVIRPSIAGKTTLIGFLLVVTVLCGFKTIERNGDWKDTFTLFSHDLHIVPNSVLVNANVAVTLMNRSDFEKDPNKRKEELHRSIELYNKALSIHPGYDKAYLNKALAYFRLGVLDSVVSNLEIVRKLYPNHPQLPDIYYNLGIAFSVNKEYDKALSAWEITLQLNPDYANAQQAINSLKNGQK